MQPLTGCGMDTAGRAMLIRILSAMLVIALSACGQGGREFSSFNERQQGAEPGPEAGSQPGVILDPVGELLEPTGLGYRVDTWLATDAGVIHQTGYGVDALPIGMDVDGDASTGSIVGADISVHFFSLLLYARTQVDVLSGAPSDMRLKVEVTLLDPRNLLGLPGLLGVVDPDLRIAMGVDARNAGMPDQYSGELLVLDSLFEFLPRFTSAQYNVTTNGGREEVTATLAMFADRAGQREDTLELKTVWQPAVDSSSIDVVLTPDSTESSLAVDVSSPSALTVDLHSTNGLADEPTAYRDVTVTLDAVNQNFNLLLTGVDGLEVLDETDTRYELSTDEPIDRVGVKLADGDSQRESFAEASLGALPTSLEIVQAANGDLRMAASAAIDDISFAQSVNTPVVWSQDTDPNNPFKEHVLRFVSREDGTDVTQVRLAGLQNISAAIEPDLILDGELLAAPLQFREETDTGFVDARLERLPGSFSVRFPDDSKQLRFSYEADQAGPGLHYEKQDLEESTVANIQPLPASFSLCASSDESCGSHGDRTVASINFQASEPMRVNYRQRSADGKRETAVEDLYVKSLVIDAGMSSAANKGYLYFDTAGEAFHGRFLQRDGGSGMYLRFSEGTYALERKVNYKNYIQIDKRRGQMKCPGKEELELRSGGTWYNLGFVLDQMCQ